MARAKTYTVIYAEDVPHYAIGEITARGPKDAIAKARKIDTDTFGAYDADWDNPVCRRIVSIEDAKGNDVARDLPLDNYSLERGSEDELRMRQYAQELLAGLELAHGLLEGIADKLLYAEGQPVTFLEPRDIESVYNDAICELAPLETLIRKARGQA
jgi:hypothetical protein